MTNFIKKDILEEIELKTGKIKTISLLSKKNNTLYLIEAEKPYILKFIKDRTTNFVLERKIFEILGGKKYIIAPRKGREYMLYQYLEGTILADIADDGKLKEEIVNQVFNFISNMRRIESQGYGDLNNELVGRYNSWKEFLIAYIQNQINKAKRVPKKYSGLVSKRMSENIELITRCQVGTVPMDLNLNNFVLDNKNKLKPINIPVVWRGDILAPYGELAVHIFRTKLWDYFLEKLKSKRMDKQSVLFYMLLMSYTILVFVSNNTKERLENARPWGNNRATFFEIIEFCDGLL